MTKIKEGIILYTIEKDECLNGIYTNEQGEDAGCIFNEIARRDVADGIDPIAGMYSAVHFDPSNKRVNSILDIKREIWNPKILVFSWVNADTGDALYKGVGYEMTDKMIAVHYQSH